MPQKTNKSVAKRFTVTRRGKVLYRPRHQNHFRAKKSADTKREARGKGELADAPSKKIKGQFLPHH